MHALGSQAFLYRQQFQGCNDAHILANTMRLAHVELIRADDTLLVLSTRDGSLARTLAQMPVAGVVYSVTEAAESGAGHQKVIAIGNAGELAALASWSEWKHLGRLALCWQDEAPVPLPSLDTPVLRGWWHEVSGTLLSTETPDPLMPKEEEGTQLCMRAGSLGRLLPGLAYHQEAGGLRISGLAPGDEQSLWLEHGVLDDMGFITLQPSA